MIITVLGWKLLVAIEIRVPLQHLPLWHALAGGNEGGRGTRVCILYLPSGRCSVPLGVHDSSLTANCAQTKLCGIVRYVPIAAYRINYLWPA